MLQLEPNMDREVFRTGMTREAIFRGIEERVDGLLRKAPLPFWMKGEKLPAEEVEELSELSQLEYGITHDLMLRGIDPDGPQGRKEAAKVLRQIEKDYHWLS